MRMMEACSCSQMLKSFSFLKSLESAGVNNGGCLLGQNRGRIEGGKKADIQGPTGPTGGGNAIHKQHKHKQHKHKQHLVQNKTIL